MAPGAITNGDTLTAQGIQDKLQHKGPFTSEATETPLDASKLVYTKTTTPRAVPALDDPIRNVSSYATDHMEIGRASCRERVF